MPSPPTHFYREEHAYADRDLGRTPALLRHPHDTGLPGVHGPRGRDAAIAAFNAHAVRDPRVDVVMLTVRDGITVACKR